MKFGLKMLAVISAVAMLAACETAPNSGRNGNSDGNTIGRDGTQEMVPGTGIGDRVFFDYDSSVIQSDGEAVLQKQAEWLKKNGGASVTVEGHCDERGTREYNLALGERRATAVKTYLTNLGVSSSRIQTISYGKERPAVTGSDDSAWGQNRRGVTVVGK